MQFLNHKLKHKHPVIQTQENRELFIPWIQHCSVENFHLHYSITKAIRRCRVSVVKTTEQPQTGKRGHCALCHFRKDRKGAVCRDATCKDHSSVLYNGCLE